jgi:hypothetical protein
MAGRAISFATFDQRNDVRDIERLVRTGLKVRSVPTLPLDRFPRPQLPPYFAEKARNEAPPRPFGRSPKRGTGKPKRRR